MYGETRDRRWNLCRQFCDSAGVLQIGHIRHGLPARARRCSEHTRRRSNFLVQWHDGRERVIAFVSGHEWVISESYILRGRLERSRKRNYRLSLEVVVRGSCSWKLLFDNAKLQNVLKGVIRGWVLRWI